MQNYIYIYIYLCMCVYICIYLYKDINTYMCTYNCYVHVYVQVYVYVHLNVHVNVYISATVPPKARSGVLECSCLLAGRLECLLYRDPPPPTVHNCAQPRARSHDFFSIIFLIIFGHRFQPPFGSILEPTWIQLGLQNRPKIDPRAIQNPLKKSILF